MNTRAKSGDNGSRPQKIGTPSVLGGSLAGLLAARVQSRPPFSEETRGYALCASPLATFVRTCGAQSSATVRRRKNMT